MKLSTRDLPAYFSKPDPKASGILIYGADAMRVALRRQELLKNLLGPEAEAEMRLERILAADLRSDAASLRDAIKAQGFFPGPRAVFVDQVTDAASAAVLVALEDWAPGDAQIIVTAASLRPTSQLRKAFESSRQAYAAPIYDEPPSRSEVEAVLRTAGIGQMDRSAEQDILALATSFDPGDFAQFVEKLAVYKHGDPAPVSSDDVAAVAPLSVEAALDEALLIVADGQVDALAPVLSRLASQGTSPTALCIGAARHFRTLYGAAIDPKGPGAGLARARPPVFGPRRARMERQARAWGAPKLEQALALLVETDLRLRSTSKAPQMALVERALVRLAVLGRP
ncbi:MAG: DNA polymerase III subunit delta [Pseudomonadota bacterium]